MMNDIKKTTREILEDNRRRTSPLRRHFILMAHNIRSMYNVGSIFRTADAFGIHSLLLAGYTPTPPRAEISKTAIGAEESVKWEKINKPLEKVNSLKNRGYIIYGLEQTHQSERLDTRRPVEEKVCLIIGNEVTGIDDSLIPAVDRFIEIPQFGEKHSLNVSVAAGIALYAFLEKLSES